MADIVAVCDVDDKRLATAYHAIGREGLPCRDYCYILELGTGGLTQPAMLWAGAEE